MFGFRGKRARNIKVGFKGPTLHTGPRRARVGSGFCDTLSEFLYSLCSAILKKFGGYGQEHFKEATWGDYMSIWRCTDPEVNLYTRNMVRIARTAMKQNQLIAFEVAVVDGNEFPLCTFTIHFRKNPDFKEAALWQNRKVHREFSKRLGEVIRRVQRLRLSEDMQGFVDTAATRLRIRVQLDEGFKQTAKELDLLPDSPLPQPWHSDFVPIGDPVTNLFNQVFFSAIVCEPPSTEEQDQRWELHGR